MNNLKLTLYVTVICPFVDTSGRLHINMKQSCLLVIKSNIWKYVKQRRKCPDTGLDLQKKLNNKIN